MAQRVGVDALLADLEYVERVKARLESYFGPIEVVLLRDYETWEEVDDRERWKRIRRNERDRQRDMERLRAEGSKAPKRKANTRDRRGSLRF